MADDNEQQQSSTITIHLRVIGMMCQKNCGSTVQAALANTPGVISAEASFSTASATAVIANDAGVDVEDLIDAVECVGFDCCLLSDAEDLDAYVPAPSVALQTDVTPTGFTEPDATIITTNNNSTSDEEETFHAIYSVSGMSCAVCTGRVERLLVEATPQAIHASVILSTGKARVIFRTTTTTASNHVYDDENDEEESSSDFNAIALERQALQQVPRLAQAEMERCASLCATAVSHGGYECQILSINTPGNDAKDNGLSLQDNAARMERSRAAELGAWKHLLLTSLVFTVPLVAVHAGIISVPDNNDTVSGAPSIKEWIMLLLATPVQFYVGRRFYLAAYKGLRGGVMGMDFLVVMGTSAAYLYSIIIFLLKLYCGDCNGASDRPPTFETGAMLLTFVTFGKFLEAYARGKTATALQTLMQLQPVIGYKVENTDALTKESNVSIHALRTIEVPISDIKLDDLLVVLPGARIPTDGVIVAREGGGSCSYVDESALSGEPFPVAKGIGDDVFGSCVNQLSVLLIKVTATGGETFLARIVKLIEDAQASKAPIQAHADKVAGKFAPMVMILSTITFCAWAAFGPGDDIYSVFYKALMSAISVVVIACPCALGLATPTAVMVGTGVGARNGLLIKGGAVLEKASTISTVVFDKTGTLTTGRAVMGDKVDFVAEGDDLLKNCPSGVDKENISLWLAACAESCSEHPLGKTIFNAARKIRGDDPIGSQDGVCVSSFLVEPGSGVECIVERAGWGKRTVRVGNKEWACDSTSSIGVSQATELRQKGQIVVYVSVSDDTSNARRVVSVLGIVDPIEAEAKSCVGALHDMGIDVWICTGDHEITANAVASQIGIDSSRICANVKPEGKADLISRLQKRNKSNGTEGEGGVAVVGDGINDAVALARADVGIAIGAGTEVAVEAADIVLIRSSLHDVVVALHLSKVVFRRIQLNFVWATAYNLCALPVAMGVLYPFTSWTLPPAFAGLMMAFSSVSVVFSSLLLNLYSKPNIQEEIFGGAEHGGAIFSVFHGKNSPHWTSVATSTDFNGDDIIDDGLQIV
mmetsp:Transcript_12318/g.18480  ORF Transcript_12318/g.18480 Transcript_12318/m.18480 type:complete len:1049 (+) Transcript_12318:146-3292(+)|eukprot:CAMPEP_0196814998 /NCGR_PEP_ID=MMETSP1362-20130617/47228_1 /TAXON_ID=163516 /ORGANISM="Leptocylindrus danicus, Strain CCMP1856" /LENGTH=1048 /DNA_ID=CAMNT_0042191819 /DNA_START=56 /DNA_END=3202 /DNA_ORIENTATION=+